LCLCGFAYFSEIFQNFVRILSGKRSIFCPVAPFPCFTAPAIKQIKVIRQVMMSVSMASFYITGGTLQRDAACYIERQADTDLYNGLKEGRFCYVLTSRQMGKSSLMVRTANRLREEGIGVAVLDLTAIGQNLNPEQWYNGLLNQLGQRLNLEDELYDFSYEHKELGPLQRWMRAIREVVLPLYRGRVVIFVDEIDTVRSLPFSTDEFFAGIRELYNGRTEDQELERLTFCLLGVATPSDLMRDTRTTPFNIGQRIELNDFTEREALPLARGLRCEQGQADKLLRRVLYWTGGHPYLTQRICKAVAEEGVKNAAGVDDICERLFFSHRAQERDDNLMFARQRILRSEVDLAGLLELYRRVRRGKRVRDEETSQLVNVLRLSGMARVENGYLRVRNRIYERAFDVEWVKANMPDAELRRQRRAFWRGLLFAATSASVILAVIVGLWFDSRVHRSRAEQKELEKSRLLYASQMNLAQQAWQRAEISRSLELLDGQQSRPGERDFRSFEWFYLWRLCHSELSILPHTNAVNSVAVSPDGKILAAGTGRWLFMSKDPSAPEPGTVRLWDLETGQEMATLKGHTDTVRSVAFSPDGRLLATGSDDKSAKLWDIATLQVLATFGGHKNGINSVAFSQDGKRLATASSDTTVKLWDLAARRELATLEGHKHWINSIAFSPDGKILATSSFDKTIRLWNLANQKEFALLSGHMDRIFSVAFSPDGKLLASGSGDKSVKLWDVATRKEIATLQGHTHFITAVTFSPDGRTLATGSSDSTVKLWDVATGQEMRAFRGHTDMVSSLAFSPDGRRLITGSVDKTVRLWDPGLDQEWITLEAHQSPLFSIALSPDGKTLATGSRDMTVKLWDMATWQELITLKGHNAPVISLAFSPDGKRLASGDAQTVKLWNIATGQELITLKGYTGFVTFSPDGKLLAAGSWGNTIKIWDTVRQQDLTILKGHTNRVRPIAVSPDGKILASGSEDKTVRLWDTVTWRELSTLRGHKDVIVAIAFSQDGKMLATSSDDNIVKLWDVAGREEIVTLKGYKGTVSSMAFSKDGKRLAAGSWDNTVKLWDVATWQELFTLKWDKSPVLSVAFSPDGKYLVTGNGDGTVKVLRAATEEEVLVKSKQ
jgi:WD40 repeat protein